MNPPSTPTLEPIYSLPVGAAAIGLLLIVGAMVAAFNFVGDGLNEALSPG